MPFVSPMQHCADQHLASALPPLFLAHLTTTQNDVASYQRCLGAHPASPASCSHRLCTAACMATIIKVYLYTRNQPAPSFTHLTHPRPLARLLESSWSVMNASSSVRRSSEPSWTDLSRPWRVYTTLGHVFGQSWTPSKSQENKPSQKGSN